MSHDTGPLAEVSDRLTTTRELASTRVHQEIALILADATTMDADLPRMLEVVASSLDWNMALLWRLDPTTEMLRCEASWSSQDTPAPRFEQMSRNILATPGEGLAGSVFRAEKPAWLSEISGHSESARWRVAARDNIRSAVACPVRFARKVVGVIELFSTERRVPDPATTDVLTGVGSSIGLFIERARLLEGEHRVHLRNEHSAGYLVGLEQLTQALAEASSPSQVAVAALDEGAALLGASSATFCFLVDDGRGLQAVAPERGYQPLIDPCDRVLIDEACPVAHCIRSGQAIYVDAREALMARYPRLRSGASTELNAVVSAPVFVDGQIIGAVAFGFREQRKFFGEERTLLMAVAQGAAQALRRVRAQDAERDARHARDAQRTMITLLRTELEAAHQARDNAAKVGDEILAMLSHELRTPLQAILGWADVLPRDGLDEDLRQGLDAIERNATRLTRVVESLLDAAQLVAGQVTLDLRPINVSEVARASLESVRADAAFGGVTVEAQGLMSAEVMGDAARLEQAVSNLLENAVRFTPRGGRVELSVSHVDDGVALRVSDTGEGLRPEALAKVFEQFQRGDSSAHTAPGSLGLGLSIVRHIAALHEGTLSAESEGEGRGATFTLMLPPLTR